MKLYLTVSEQKLNESPNVLLATCDRRLIEMVVEHLLKRLGNSQKQDRNQSGRAKTGRRRHDEERKMPAHSLPAQDGQLTRP